MKKRRHVRATIISAIIIALFAFLASCGGGGDSDTAAGASGAITIQYKDPTDALSSTFPPIPADGSSSVIIHAEVTDSAGNPVRHYTDVTFSTNLGHFMGGATSITIQTQPPLDDKGWPDRNADPTGVAEVTFTSGTTSGVAKVTVTSNNVTQTVYITISGSPAGIKLTAAPASIPADGSSSSTITATLTDASGSPVTPGTSVTFTTGLGSFAGSGTASAQAQALLAASGGKSCTVTTPDATGTVSVSLMAGLVPGTTYVVATSNYVSQSLSFVMTNAYRALLFITAAPKYIAADGISTSLVQATVTDVSGTPQKDVAITFYDASIDTESTPLPDNNLWKGTGTNLHVTPDFYSYGGSTDFIMTYSGSSISNFAVRLWNRDTGKVSDILINTTGPVTGQTITKNMVAGNYYFQVDASGEWEIKIDGSITTSQKGDPVVLAVTRTDANGHADFTYTSTLVPGTVKIKAETGEPTIAETNKEALKATVEIIQTQGPPTRITVTALDSSLYANGVESTTIQATVLDANYNPAPDGTVVAFSATSGTINATAQTKDGVASATLTSVKSSINIDAIVTGTVDTHSDSTTVTFLGVSLTDMKAEPSVIIANGTDTSTISVRLQDENGAAISKKTITFSTTGGTLKSSSAETDDQGLAAIELIAPSSTGVATVTASYGLINQGTDVTFQSSPVGTVSVSAGSSSLVADGKSSTLISAEVKDQSGKHVADGTSVSFTTSAGTLSSATATTTNGVAKVTLTSSTHIGTASVMAISDGVNDTTSVSFVAGSVITLSVVAIPDNLSADGVSTSTIQATVKDAYSNPVSNETINFAVLSGSLSAPSAKTDASGIATVTYTAPHTVPPGNTDTVTAISTNGTSGTETITLITALIGSVSVTAGSSSIVADGVSSTLISATVKDTNGNAVADGTSVSFSTTAGALSAATATTTNGVATVTLTSPTILGSATITGTSGGVNDTAKVSFVAGSVNTVSVLAIPENLSADGVSTSTIQATVKDAQDNPVSGATINFTVVSGSLSAASATANASGIATVTYTAPHTVPAGGTDTVTATSTNGTTGSDTITIIEPIVGSVSVTAGSSSIVADGASSTLISATVKDTNGNNVADGTSVSFTTTAGILSAATATTINGVAAVTLTSSTVLGAATVTATSGGVNNTAGVSFVAGSVSTVNVLATPDNLSAGVTNTSTIQATVRDLHNNPVSGETISFTIVSGSLSTAIAVTNASGIATATYTAPNTVPAGGTDTVTATSTNGATGSDTITIIAAAVGSVTVTAGCPSIVADGASSTLLTATVKDTNGNNIADGTSVSFATTAGTLSVATATTTNGVATVTITSSTNLGTATIIATSGGVNDSTTVSFIAGPVSTVNVLATPDNLSAGVTNTSTIQATVRDLHNNPVSGETISFIVVSGSLSAATGVTNASGIATVTYTAPNTVPAGGTDTVTATSTNGKTGSDTITIIAAMVGSVTVTAGSGSIVADGISSTLIVAAVKDVNGNNVADGTSVSFKTTAGTLSAATATTTNGVATVTITSSTNLGTATITATSGGVNDTTAVSFIAGPVSTVNVLATPDNLSAAVTNTSTIQATLRDLNNNPVSGETISFTIVSGSLSAATAVTDASGIATVTYTAPNTVPAGGTDTVTATSTNGTTASDTITIIAAMVGSVNVTAGSSNIVADGTSSTVISATVKDTTGNNVKDGTTVSFTTTAGVLSSATAITANGVATVTLTSSTSLATAMVMATCGGVNDTTNVDFIGGPVDTLSLVATPGTLLANGSGTSTIRAEVRDAQGNRVADGEPISFVITSGTGTLSASSAPTVGGFATVTYTASKTPGSVVIQAMADNGVSDTTTITLTSGGVGSITLAASPASIPADGSSSSIITATVKDTTGNPVLAGTVVTFLTNLGTLSSTSVTTSDDTGIVVVSLIAGTTPGGAVVEASSGGVSQSVTVAFTGGVGVLILNADPANIPADGSTSSSITATVKDAGLKPVPTGTSVTFTTSLGTFSNTLTTITVSTPDNTGVVAVSLIASTTPGTATVIASSSGVTQTVTVTISGGAEPASLSLATSQTSVKSDNSDSATITATLLDVNNAPIVGVTVGFSADTGQISASSAITDANGEAKITFSSGTSDTSNRTATITATVAGLAPISIPIEILGSILTLSTDRTTIPDDRSNPATLRATAKDGSGSPISNATITFTVTSGDGGGADVIPPSGNTNASGWVEVSVEGTSVGTITVTASGLGIEATQNYTVTLVGNTFAIVLPETSPFSTQTRSTASLAVTGDNVQIAFNDNSPLADTITRADGNSFIAEGYQDGDTIMVGGSLLNDGVYTIASRIANTLTLVASDSLNTEPIGATVTITNGVLVRVRAPGPIATVSFATTIGVWNAGASPFLTELVPPSNIVWAVLTSSLAGSATVQVYDADNPSTTDKITVAFSVPSGDAEQITLQSNVYMVAPSIGGTTNTSTLTATVRTSLATGSQLVSGVSVAFAILNPTGGGETLSQTVVVTNSAGQAQTTFTSGALSTGAEGVTIIAWIVGKAKTWSNAISFTATNTITRSDPGGDFAADGFVAGDQISVRGSTNNDRSYTLLAVLANTLTVTTPTVVTEVAGALVAITEEPTDSVNIVIGGTAGSVVIGRGTVIYDVNDATYRLPMAALVTDSNGNAVSGAVVTLSAWPLQYAAGVWYDDDPDPDDDFFVVYYTGPFIDNEDANENLILDPGEDKDGDGKLTPPSSSAGGVPVPAEVTTDEHGVAQFDLYYLKASAEWIRTRVRASTFVVGTETTSSLTMKLPAEEQQAEQGLLPDSPFPIGLVSGTAFPPGASYTFPTFKGTGDAFTTSSNLSAGESSMGAPVDDYDYTYDPTGGTPAIVGDWVWDFVMVINGTAGVGAYFPVRIIIQ